MSKTGGSAKLIEVSTWPEGRDQAIAGLDKNAMETIVSASQGDPFAILGPHEIASNLWEIRTMLPEAESVEALAASDGALIAASKSAIRRAFLSLVSFAKTGRTTGCASRKNPARG